MYADDTAIYYNLEDFDSNNFEFEINAELQKVSMWLKKNKLSLNLDKTKLMIFHRQQKKVKELNITINGTNIERVLNGEINTFSRNYFIRKHVLG